VRRISEFAVVLAALCLTTPAFAGDESTDRLVDPLAAIDGALLLPPADARRLERRAAEAFAIGGAPAEYESPWSFEIGLAGSLARGNTETFDLLADGKVNYERNQVKAELKAAYMYGEAKSVTTSENWHIQARMERRICGRSYGFGKYNYDRDPFADLDYRHTGILGYGRTLIDREKTKLKGELGGGMVWEQRLTTPPTASPAAYLGLDFSHEWGAGNTFTLDYDFVPYLNNFDLSYMTWDMKFGTPLCKGLDLTVGARVGWVIEPPAPTKPLDLLLAVGLRLKL